MRRTWSALARQRQHRRQVKAPPPQPGRRRPPALMAPCRCRPLLFLLLLLRLLLPCRPRPRPRRRRRRHGGGARSRPPTRQRARASCSAGSRRRTRGGRPHDRGAIDVQRNEPVGRKDGGRGRVLGRHGGAVEPRVRPHVLTLGNGRLKPAQPWWPGAVLRHTRSRGWASRKAAAAAMLSAKAVLAKW